MKQLTPMRLLINFPQEIVENLNITMETATYDDLYKTPLNKGDKMKQSTRMRPLINFIK